MIQKFTRTFGLIALTALSTLIEAQMNWSPAGPIYTAGRARNMVVDKNDPSGNTLYIGSASSGVFKSTDGGANWAPIDDQGTVRNISYLAQAPDGTIYAGTGEGFLRQGQKSKALPGTGLYKLQGNALILVASSNDVGTVINRVAVSPLNSNIIALGTNKGIMVSTDGVTFSLPGSIPTATNLSGQDVKFDSQGILYCSHGNETYAGVSPTLAPTKVYRSTDATLSNFNNITPTSSVLVDQNYGRIELAVAPSNNNIIYASVANKNPDAKNTFTATLRAFFVSYDAGSTWAMIHQGFAGLDPLTNGAQIASGDYAHVIVVHPTNPHQVFYGGYSLYLWTRNFSGNGDADASPKSTWRKLGSAGAVNSAFFLNPNVHDIKVIPGNPLKLYVITDAGIFRSLDVFNTLGSPATFQPFYKGLITGQFNSVSIERYPVAANSTSSVSGTKFTPNSGFIGGTGGNGLTYYSGTALVPTQEINYIGGEIYNAEYSKILPNVVYASRGDGIMYRSTNIKSSAPAPVNMNRYFGVLSKITPTIEPFGNLNITTGTPFKLWEWYGQTPVNPDSAYFYNDTVRFQTSVATVPELINQSSFTISTNRPNRFAAIDSIVIRTGTVQIVGAAPYSSAYNGRDITMKLNPNYTNTGSVTVISGTVSHTPSTTTNAFIAESFKGPISLTNGPKVTINNTTLTDDIVVTFTAPPFGTQTLTSATVNNANYYRVFATVFYKYKAGDSVTILDNNISTMVNSYKVALDTAMIWSYWNKNTNLALPYKSGSTVIMSRHNRRKKVATLRAARLAVSLANNAITGSNISAVVISKTPLSLNDPLSFVRVSLTNEFNWTDDANGNPVKTSIIVQGRATVLEWSKSGTELYFATDANRVYRVSHITEISDLSPSSYSGKFFTDSYVYNNSGNNAPNAITQNQNSPYRTTLIGQFDAPISSISIGKDDETMVLTFNPTGTQTTSAIMVSGASVKTKNSTAINWQSRTNGFPAIPTYCSLMEKDDFKKVFVGTNSGIYYNADILNGSSSWTQANNGQLPNVQIFDIEQQTMMPWDCYNSGQIYVATNGRGVWTNNDFLQEFVVGQDENDGSINNADASQIRLYPNPTSGNVNVAFYGLDGEKAVIQVMDISGRVVKTESLDNISSGDMTYTFNTSEISSGVYIVNVSSDSGVKRVAKLIISK